MLQSAFLSLLKARCDLSSFDRSIDKEISDRIQIQSRYKHHSFGQIASPKGLVFPSVKCLISLSGLLTSQISGICTNSFPALWHLLCCLLTDSFKNVGVHILSSFSTTVSLLLRLNAVQLCYLFFILTPLILCIKTQFIFIVISSSE